jgi:hypothetical protein
MATDERIRTFDEFWPFYVREHSHPTTRLLHFIGTSGFLALGTTGVLTLNPLTVAGGVAWGYGCAWIGHFFVEHNRPATFTYPLWSLKADFVMYGKMLRGEMEDEVARVMAATVEAA